MQSKSKANLLLIELILAILFFSIAISVCIRIVFSAYSVGVENRDLTRATIQCDSIMNTMHSKDWMSVLQSTYKVNTEDNRAVIYFDQNMVPTNKDLGAKSGANKAIITVDDKDRIRKVQVEFIKSDKNQSILKIDTAFYETGGSYE